MAEFDNSKIRRLDGGLLLIFRELLAYRRASEVSQRLGLSQSAISHALARLREILGDPLFIRRSHGFEPTKRALELGPRVEALIDMIGATVSRDGRFDPSQSRRRFGIACSDHITTLIADRLVESFRKNAPRANFTARHVILDRALAAVRRGEVDISIGIFDAIPRDLKSERLLEDDYCVLARKGHPKVKGKVDVVTYSTIGHVFIGNPEGALSDEAPWDREAIDATYGSMASPETVRTHGYVSQWDTAMLMVGDTDVLIDCPRSLAKKYAKRLGLQILDPPHKPFRFAVDLVRRATEDPGVDWLIEQVKAAVR
jgi:DNA-binding transcriptional LysR family regulator